MMKQAETNSKTPLISILFSGKSSCGKTALVASLAKDSGFPYIKYLAPENFVASTELERANKIHKAFQDAYKSQLSLVVIDDIERFIEYAPIGPRYSNIVLQALFICSRLTHQRVES